MEKYMKYVVVRIKDYVRVIFEDEFIGDNEIRTQNEIIEVLKLLHNEKEFSVYLYSKKIKEGE